MKGRGREAREMDIDDMFDRATEITSIVGTRTDITSSPSKGKYGMGESKKQNQNERVVEEILMRSIAG